VALLPREHGAYGQLALPLITALAVAGLSTAGLLMALSAGAAFVAHEPAAVLLGLRGARASQDLRATAVRWLVACALVTLVAGAMAVLTMDRQARWSVVVPALPAAGLAAATMRGREKSWWGEVTAALAFAGLSVPVSMAAGASLRTAATVALPFALLFITSTLAVRVVILRVRGGGNPHAMRATRRAAFAVTALGAAGLGWIVAAGALPAAALVAASPGLLTALALAVRPPQPARLRTIGWTLVTVSVLTGAILIVSR
jgi:hypothetical protein